VAALVSISVMAVMVSTTGAAKAPSGGTDKIWSPPQTPLPKTASVPGTNYKAPATPQHAAMPQFKAQQPTWPAAGRADADLGSLADTMTSSAMNSSGSATKARAGSLPLWVAAPNHSAGDLTADAKAAASVPSRVHAQMAGQDLAKALGINGVVFSVARGDGSSNPGTVAMTLDYSSFATAFGGYTDRVRLVGLPACALTTPDMPTCRVQTPIASANDIHGKTLSTDITLPGANGKTETAQTSGSTGSS